MPHLKLILAVRVMTVGLAVLAVTSRPSAVPLRAQTATSPLRFAVTGDFGTGGAPERDVAALVQSWQPAFIVTTGDNNYGSGAASTIDANIGQFYSSFIAPYTGIYTPSNPTAENRFWPALGNHDWDGGNNAKPYRDYFVLPGNERYYDLVRGDVHLFMIDSDSREPDGIAATSAQATWLQQRLAESTAPWKIVVFHHPPYSSGLHGSNTDMRWPFKAWGASLVLSGHDHTYERLQVDGLPYIVNGLGGQARYNFNLVLPQSLVRYNADFGAMRLEASACVLNIEFVNVQGQVVDAFALSICHHAVMPLIFR